MRKEFTPVELLVILTIILVLAPLLISTLNQRNNRTVQYGIGGATEVRCIDGFKCVVGDGHVTQLIGQDGKPIICVEE